MDEEELEMMLYYFLFLRKKNVLKKRGSWLDHVRSVVRSIFQKKKRLGEYNQLFMELRLGDREYFFKYVYNFMAIMVYLS